MWWMDGRTDRRGEQNIPAYIDINGKLFSKIGFKLVSQKLYDIQFQIFRHAFSLVFLVYGDVFIHGMAKTYTRSQ